MAIVTVADISGELVKLGLIRDEVGQLFALGKLALLGVIQNETLDTVALSPAQIQNIINKMNTLIAQIQAQAPAL